MRARELRLTLVPMPSLAELGTRAGWGEGWWTAADLALTHPVNNPELPSPLEAMRLAIDQRETEAFITGAAGAGRD